MNPTATDLAWMAGFFDGEGCIQIRSQFLSNGRVLFRKRVCVVNTRADVLDVFKSFFGGRIRAREYMKKYANTQNHKIVHEWTVDGKYATPFIEAILPYLRLKNRQAELWISFDKTIDRDKGRNFKGGYRNWKPEVIELRNRIVGEIKSLNKRGLK